MKKRGIFLAILIISVSCTLNSHEAQMADAPASKTLLSNEELRTSVNHFVDQWHRDASEADFAYFDKMAPAGAYLGTDPTENWTTSEFREWAGTYFKDGKTWDFKPLERNIYQSEDGRYVWFDELLDTWMGVCRGSGVLSAKDDSWQIEHYHLSMAIPNDLALKVIEMLENEQTLTEKQEDTR